MCRLTQQIIAVVFTLSLSSGVTHSQEVGVPSSLEPWREWVLWDVEHRDCPRIYSDYNTAICFWPSKLIVNAEGNGATWKQEVRVYERSWIPLPGNLGMWPTGVSVDEKLAVVVGRNGRPAVELEVGRHVIEGMFAWTEMPQRLKIPSEVGVLELKVRGESRPLTNWSSDGEVWLRRDQSEPADVDRLGVQVYRVIEDGIPVWLRTELELTVSGKSREEELGWILPEGWKVATVETALPVAIDELGRTKVQVRAGKWSILIDAFRTTDPSEIKFSAEAQPVEQQELVGLRLNSSFRISFVEGLASVDVSQTTFPDRWSGLPVYQWDTSQPLKLVEKQRGMGEKGRGGLSINRQLWLDDDGGAFTYEDEVQGEMQQIWRLDAAEDVDLGAVRIDGDSQLITRSPDGATSGVELRQRNLKLTAIGRSKMGGKISATGWKSDADSLSMVLMLPPGWRAFAILGADGVNGDWLTAWSLLDLFLLMIFSLAIFRLYGPVPGAIALLAFGLSYHEYGSPRWTWFALLVPVALLRVVPTGLGHAWLKKTKSVAVLLLALFLIPFIAHQLQGVLYPQLEVSGVSYGYRDFWAWMGDAPTASNQQSRSNRRAESFSSSRGLASQQAKVGKLAKNQSASTANLLFDPKSKIQTGPARPAWEWNRVVCSWNGPVTSADQIRPMLISMNQNRIITLIRVALLLLLSFLMLSERWKFKLRPPKPVAAMLLPFFILAMTASTAQSQQSTAAIEALGNGDVSPSITQPRTEKDFPRAAGDSVPSMALLSELRERLTQTPDAFPGAAEIPYGELELQGSSLLMTLTIHAADQVVVPLPGRFPEWSPLQVTLDQAQAATLVRKDDFLWVLVPKGVHQVVVAGMIPDQGDWEWSFLLKPKRLRIKASGWKVNGLNREGMPADQIFFSKDQPVSADRAAYDQTSFYPIVLVERKLEIGLISRVYTTVTRLSESGRAISIEVPLLEGEAVLTPNREVVDGKMSVRFGSQQGTFTWSSELTHNETINLSAPLADLSVERWSLLTSPIWNVSISGTQPFFEATNDQLVPVWRPWGGESVALALGRPKAVVGDSLTINSVNHAVSLGNRQRTTKLTVDLECSLATDFALEIEEDAEITSIQIDGTEVPQQRDGNQLVLPISPGKHQLTLAWERNRVLSTRVMGESITLPEKASNVISLINVPANRWVLWASGPLRGPAVRFWVIILVALLLALALGSLPSSPLKRREWLLLIVGLTQVYLFAAMFVVVWLFAMEYRGRKSSLEKNAWAFNAQQLGLVLLTVIALVVLVFVVAAGLLGYPDMFIVGNGSSRLRLQWLTPRAGDTLPLTGVISVSVWFYRVLMLLWALWLANALLRWLTNGWEHFTYGGAWQKLFKSKSKVT